MGLVRQRSRSRCHSQQAANLFSYRRLRQNIPPARDAFSRILPLPTYRALPRGEYVERSAAALTGLTPAPVAKLEPDAIGTVQDTIIGMASSAPATTMAVTMAGLAA